MNEVYQHVFALADECSSLCVRLQECLLEERRQLIEFKTDELPQTILKKESLSLSLSRKKKELSEFIKFHFGVKRISELEQKLPEPFRAQWQGKHAEWHERWTRVRETCERNQGFLSHSLRTLGFLVDNLKSLFGEHSLYSSRGEKVESGREGKVVEARF